jgi:HemY protein
MAPPLFRARADLGKTGAPAVPPVIPIVRAPDDPGIDDEAVSDEFTESIGPAQGQSQAGGWRGFLSRWGG